VLREVRPIGDTPPDWALRIARRIPWFPEDGILRHGYAIGQHLTHVVGTREFEGGRGRDQFGSINLSIGI
jgi:hypothetical protein